MNLKLKYPPEPEFAHDLAELCIETAARISGLKLDYSVKSLHAVQNQLDSFVEQGIQVDQIASALFCFGCYIGELIIKHLGGHWIETKESQMDGMTPWPMVIQMINGDCWNPIGKVFKRFAEGEGEDLLYFYQIIASSLDRKPSTGS